MSVRTRLTASLLSVLFLLSATASATAAPQSVQEFLTLKPRWDKLVGLKFLLEGRFGGSAGNLLSLRNLSIPFQASSDITADYDAQDVLQVLGQLQRDANGQLYFQLLDVKKRQSDMDVLQSRILDLPTREPEPVYELADWALARGQFYNDTALAAEARKLYDRALLREAAVLETRDYANYRRLAVKAVDYGLGDERKVGLLYEGHFQQWQLQRRQATSLQLAALATAAAAELPGAAVPVRTTDEEFRNKWKADPLTVYRQATFGREQLHRFLYQEIMLESIERETLPEGRNGKAIAQRYRLDLPEFADRADEFVKQELDYQVRNVINLPIERMLALREELVAGDDVGRADEALLTWFKDRETKLRREGIDGLIELASLYETLFPDGARDAVDVLLEAERRKPGSAIVRQRLESHGYQQINGEWKSSDEVRDYENSPINRAMREGRVIPGMTQEQVRRSLGAPTSVSRILTARHVIEYWAYSDSGRSSRLIIRLSRPTQRESAIVVDSREVRQ